jgi:hypothetical protein
MLRQKWEAGRVGENESLQDWVRREMTLEKTDLLVSVKERVARLLGVSTDGAVGFKLTAEQLTGLNAQERILLYMIGKLYAKAAGYTQEESVSNSELTADLGMPEGTVKSQLKVLRDARYVNSDGRGIHSLARNRMLEVLSQIENAVTS